MNPFRPSASPTPSGPPLQDLIRALEAARGGTHVIAYVTSTRDQFESPMAMDAIPIIHEHLRALPGTAADRRIDLFLHSNGGDSAVPWRLVTLIREFATRFSVLVPHRAFSAATLTALGADEVVMHPMGMLGPIDPTVTTPYNPMNPTNPGQRLGISVEDVAAYIALVREDIGVQHEAEVVQTFNALTANVHPLALGTVKRSSGQARLLGERLLRGRHGNEIDDASIADIVERLTSRLYHHGHPINRREAREELNLSFVVDAPVEVEEQMWALYSAYRDEMELDSAFQPFVEATDGVPPPLPPAPGEVGRDGTPSQGFMVHERMLEPAVSVSVDSGRRSDRYMIQLDAVIVRQWSGESRIDLSVWQSGWKRSL